MASNAGSGAQVASLFETPVILEDFPHAAQANPDFSRRILQKRNESAGVAISNVGGWHSSSDMAQWGGDFLLPLVERIVGLADRFTSDVRGSTEPRFVWYPEVWANVSGSGASNSFHYHSGCVWSAVYYVADGYRTPDEDVGGELVLLDPRAPAVTMAAPDLRYRRPDGQVYTSEAKLRPRAGRIVMFPSWLMHSVRLYRGSATRISIAVNLSAIPVPKQR
jgi:uncharacterized protein (TIGR02466 family)